MNEEEVNQIKERPTRCNVGCVHFITLERAIFCIQYSPDANSKWSKGRIEFHQGKLLEGEVNVKRVKSRLVLD